MGGRVTRIVLLVGTMAWTPAGADEPLLVYRCVAADGAVTLQDQPCPAGQTQSQRRVSIDPEAQAPPPAVLAEPEPAPEPSPNADDGSSYVPAPPPLYRCTDYEGKSRLEDQYRPNGRWVPYWVVMNTGDLAGRGGRAAEANPGQQPPGGTPQVYVEDVCAMLDDDSACAAYRDQLAEAQRQHYSRIGDEQRRLAGEIERLRAVINSSCAG